MATAGAGLEGDRYCTFGASAETQLTLIQIEAVNEFNEAFRYKLAGDRVPPKRDYRSRSQRTGRPDLHGRTSARLRGVELCEPCAYLQNLLDIPGLVKQLTHMGGLRCEILGGA